MSSIKSTSNWIETLIWFVIFYPCLLATLGAYRLVNLLCRKQLAHLCLRQKVQLLHPASSKTIDVVLMLGLAIYALAVLTCAATVGWQSVTVVAVALIGPMWTLRKALSTAGELEEQLKQNEVWAETLCSGSDLPKVKQMTWNAMIAEARSGKVFRKALESSTADGDQEDRDFNLLRDFTWHRRAVWRDGCTSGFFVVPGFAAVISAFLGVSLLQGSLYACSVGQLSNLQLATDLHSLHFQPYQHQYSVFMDTSFTQVAVQSTAKVSATRWISFQQPESAASNASATSNATDKISDDEGVGLEEIQLSQALVPRIATVRVQGVRPSLDPTEFAIRFSPLRTLPFLVTLTAENFSAKVAWSTLPGSILSLPEGLGSFDMTVSLVDFHLGLPVCNESKLETLQWTVFEHMRHDNESCDSRCNDELYCLVSFRGHGGCYFAFNNYRSLESGDSISEASLSSSLRRLSGSLSGCVPDCGNALKAEQHKIHFRGIHPDWQGNSGQLTFALQLEVGEQRFESDFGAMDLHRGVPLVSDAIVQVAATMKNGTKISIGYTLRTAQSDITVVIHEYDPTEVKQLQLLVLPVLADKAFTAEWTDPKLQIQESEMKALGFSKSTRCIESSLLQNRYNACGSGPLKDLPISMGLDPWISSFTPKPFTVALRKDSTTRGTFNSIEQKLKVAWNGVDAPAAWAAKHKACELLTISSEVNGRVAASADALCELMKSKCFSQVEELMRDSKFGTSWQSDELLLASKGFQSVGCCHKHGQCSLKWSYEHGKLRLENTQVQVSLNSFMEFLGQTVSAGNELSLQARGFPMEFLKLVVEKVWQMPRLESILAAEVATWHSEMPKELLVGMIEAGNGEAANFGAKQAQAIFGKVTTLKVKLRDPAQLKDIPVALRLAGNISTVKVSCFGCPGYHAPKAEHWHQLTEALCQVESVRIDNFHIGRLAPWRCNETSRVQSLVLSKDGITELPEELFQGTWSHLKGLGLHDNGLRKLPPKLFQGLASLQTLDLEWTSLTELPDELFRNLTKLRLLLLEGNERLHQLPSICDSEGGPVKCNT